MSRWTCHLCGEGWDHHPAAVVACPQCERPAGSPCQRPSGHNTYGGIPHVAREQLAVDTGLLKKCAKSA